MCGLGAVASTREPLGPGLALESSACPGAEEQPDCEVPRASPGWRESERIAKVEEE